MIDPAADPGIDPVADPGIGLAIDLGIGLVTDRAVDHVIGLATDPGSDPGSDLAIGLLTDLAADLLPYPVTDLLTGRVSGSDPARAPGFAPDSAAALRARAAGNGNSVVRAYAAARLVADSDPSSTAAGRPAAGQAPGRIGGPIGPNRFCAAPNHGPSARPNGVAHPGASRGSSSAPGGSSAQERAG